MATTFKPIEKMAANAKRGLKVGEEFSRAGTDVGVHRANHLAAQDVLDESDVKSIHSYLARHAVDEDGKTHEWNYDVGSPAGYIAWLLWGGDAGKAWADRHSSKLGT